MTRVSTYGQSQLLMIDLLRNEQRIFETQKQVTSGNKAQQYQGIAHDVATLMGSRSIEARTEQFLKSNLQVERRLEIQNAAVQGLVDVANDLRTEIFTAIGNGSGVGLRNQIDNLFNTAVNLLHTQENGRYVFSGTRTDTPPIADTTPAALEARTPLANTFQNNSVKQRTKIDDSQTLTYGLLASDLVTDLFTLFQNLMVYETANGFSDQLTAAQSTFLEGEIGRANTAFDTLNAEQARHGMLMKTLEQTQDRLEGDKTFIKGFIADIQEVDIAEAVSRLNQDQVALEASYRVFSQLSNLTLLDFI